MAVIEITKREALGSRPVRRLREAGLVPGIIYGHGEANVPVSLQAHDLELALIHGAHLLEADLDGKRENLLIKEVQYDQMGTRLLHVDLTRVSLDERVVVTVPIELRGTPAGVEKAGGVLTQHLAQLTVECVVTAIPDDIRVLVGHLNVEESIRVADLVLPEGIRALAEPDTMVASVSVLAEEVAAPVGEEGAEPAEPEVIGAKPSEEEEEAAEEKKKEKKAKE